MTEKLRFLAFRLVADRRGVTALEYALIASLVGIAAIAGATTLGTKISGAFTYIAGKLVTQ